jgi:hypothetical protein
MKYTYKKSQNDAQHWFISLILKKKLLLINLLFIVILAPIFYLSLTYIRPTKAAWHDDAYLYRKQITIGNSGSTISSARKVKIDVDTATLIAASKMQSDCDDTRFVDTNGKLLRYFIDTDEGACNTSSTDFYVELSTVPTGTNFIYMYYGNPSATSTRDNEFFAPSTSTALGNKLKGYWKLDETSSTRYDSAHENSLTDNNTVSSNTGKVNTAAEFNYSNSESLTRNDNADLSTGDVDFTISAWVYITDKNDLRPIVAKDDGSGSREYLLSYDQGSDLFIFEIFDGANSIAQVKSNTIGSVSTSTWYFITAWHDTSDDTINIQINNGTADSLSTGGTGPTDTGETFSIGKNRETVWHFDGRIDNVLLWKRTLTSGEKSALYNSGNGLDFGVVSFTPTTGPTLQTEESTPTPVVYWKFDEGFDTTAQDTTLNNNDGTISGATWTNEGDCVAGKCLSFDGSNDKVTKSYSSDTELAPGTGSFTISGWFKHASTQSGTDTILSRADGVNGVGYKVYMDSSGYVCFGIDGTAGSFPADSACSTTSFADSKWHQFSAVKTSTTSITLYIDGTQIAQDASLATTGSISGTSSGLYFGIDADGSSNPWTGFIDDVKIYPFARSAAQIKTDSNFAGSVKGTSLTFGANNQERLTEGLVGYWKTNETSWSGSAGEVIDYSGNSNNGTATNGPSTTSTGKFGYAGNFNQSDNNDYVDLGNDSDFNVTTFTIGAWVYRTGTCGTFSHCYVFSDGMSGNTGYALRMTNDNGYKAELSINDGQQNITGTTVINTNTWYHVVATSNGSEVKIYVNGVLETTTAQTVTPSFAGQSSKIGNGNTGNDLPFTGRLDEIRFYNRVLSGSEIQQIANFAPGPVGYWNFDEKTGTTANDTSGNGYTGTLTLGPTWTNGKIGAAIDFDGSNDRVTTASTLGLTTANVSASAWVYLSSSSLKGGFIKVGSNGNGYAIGVGSGSHDTNGNNLILLYEGVRWIDTSTAIGTGWHHVAMNIDASGVPSAYLDGVYLGSFSGTGAVTPTTRTDLGGNDPTGSNPRYFAGKVDEVRIYNYPRSQAQILEDMNGGHAVGGSPVGSQVGYWKFDEGSSTSANDISVNSNTLTLSTATSAWTNSGKFNKAWDGNGSRYVSRSDDSDFDVSATDDYSISMWFKSDSASNPAATEYIINKASATAPGYAIYANTSGQICFAIDDDATWSPDIASCTTNDYYDGNWHHVVGMRDYTTNDKTYIYIDGQIMDSDSDSTTATLANGQSLYIGDRDGTDNGDEFTGDIDEVKIYRSALTYPQILTEFNHGGGITLGSTSTTSAGANDNSAAREYCIPGDSTSCSSPVGEWKLDEKSGTSANDSTGNANTGTITAGSGGWINGKIGSAYNFDTADTVINSGSGSTLDNLPSSGMTIEAWIYPKSAGENSLGFIVAKNSGTTPNAGWILRLNSTTSLTFTVDGSTDLVSTTNTSLLTQNAWNHVAVSWDGVITTASSVHIYINGKEATYATQTNGASRVDDGSSTLYIGNDSTSARTFDGYIDHVRIFNYSRNQAQVAWDVNRGLPIARYKFDECSGVTAYDTSGNGNNGTLTPGASGNTTTGSCNSGTSTEMWNDGTTGKFNASAGFDGTDDYVTVADANALDQTGNLTISMWVNPTALSNTEAELLQKGTSDDCQNYGLALYGGTTLALLSSNSCSWSYAGTNAVLTTGSWQYVTATYDGTNVRYYINGTLKDTVAWGGIGSANSGALVIGGGPSQASSDYFNGLIDDVRIYNYALTGAQIKNVMNEGSAIRFGPSSGQP